MRCPRLSRLVAFANPAAHLSRQSPWSALLTILICCFIFGFTIRIYPDSMRVNVAIRIGDAGIYSERMKAVEFMLSPHHVDLNIAPLAFLAVEYGDGDFSTVMV